MASVTVPHQPTVSQRQSKLEASECNPHHVFDLTVGRSLGHHLPTANYIGTIMPTTIENTRKPGSF